MWYSLLESKTLSYQGRSIPTTQPLCGVLGSLHAEHVCAHAGLLLKSVASGAIDILLACAECEDHAGSDFVHIVGGGAGRRGTVRCIEDAIMHVGRPPLVCVGAGYALELPVAPAWFSEPPEGSMEDGIHLSLLALEQVRNRPEIFAQRDQQMCDVEFTL